MTQNIHPFRPKKPQASSKARLFAVLFPLAIGYAMVVFPMTWDTFNIFLLLGILYWVFIRRHAIETTYFTRNHYLHTTMGQLFIFMVAMLFFMVVTTASSVLTVLPITALATPIAALLQSTQLAYHILAGGLAVWLAFTGVQGKTPTLPIISSSVEYWA